MEKHHQSALLWNLRDMLYHVTSLVGNRVCTHAIVSQTNMQKSGAAHLCPFVIFGEVVLTQRNMETTVNVICIGSVSSLKEKKKTYYAGE